jgi:hypothetical protein
MERDIIFKCREKSSKKLLRIQYRDITRWLAGFGFAFVHLGFFKRKK